MRGEVAFNLGHVYKTMDLLDDGSADKICGHSVACGQHDGPIGVLS